MPQKRTTNGSVRIDKWLWATRFFKTRQLAADAIKSGKIEVNKNRAKPARTLAIGDVLLIRKDNFRHEVVVRQLSSRRQSATLAADMYEETANSLSQRQEAEARIRLQARQVQFDRHKPDRRRRELSRRVKRNDV